MPKNCYAYATKYSLDQALDPGVLGGRKYKDTSIREMRKAAVADGLIFLSDVAARLPDDYGNYPFIVAGLASTSVAIAYHWVRRDANGEWSHKFGDGTIIQFEPSSNDAAGKALSDGNHAGVADWDFGANFRNLTVGKLAQENDQSGWLTRYDRFLGWYGCSEYSGILFCNRKSRGCTIL